MQCRDACISIFVSLCKQSVPLCLQPVSVTTNRVRYMACYKISKYGHVPSTCVHLLCALISSLVRMFVHSESKRCFMKLIAQTCLSLVARSSGDTVKLGPSNGDKTSSVPNLNRCFSGIWIENFWIRKVPLFVWNRCIYWRCDPANSRSTTDTIWSVSASIANTYTHYQYQFLYCPSITGCFVHDPEVHRKSIFMYCGIIFIPLPLHCPHTTCAKSIYTHLSIVEVVSQPPIKHNYERLFKYWAYVRIEPDHAPLFGDVPTSIVPVAISVSWVLM